MLHTHTGRAHPRWAAHTCFRSATARPRDAEAAAWRAAGKAFQRALEAELAFDFATADGHYLAAVNLLDHAGLALPPAPGKPDAPAAPLPADPPPMNIQDSANEFVRMMRMCGLRAQTLRMRADRARRAQAHNGAVEYGAAAALERAADEWGRGRAHAAEEWMQAAEQVLLAHLLPVPWAAAPYRPRGRHARHTPVS